MEIILLVIVAIFIMLWMFDGAPVTIDEEKDQVIIRSQFSRFGDPTAPHIIVITNKFLTWKKNKGYGELWLSSDSVTIQLDKITGVHIHSKLIGCALEITTQGLLSIYARNLRECDAEMLREVLMS